jgi:YesN/AraC family two-component response regulator
MSDLVKLKNLTKNLSVLYVEDSAILLKRMSTFLNHLFKEVYQANNGKEGLESFKQNKPDIIITDLNMPVMSGHELIKNIKILDSNANIIVVSAYSDTENL